MSDISVVFNDFLLAVHVCHKCLLLTYIDITYNDHQVNVGVCMSFTLPFLLSRDMGKKNDKSCMGLSWGICIKSQLTLLKLPLSLVLWRVFFLSIVTDHYMVVIKEELYIRTILIGYVLRSYWRADFLGQPCKYWMFGQSIIILLNERRCIFIMKSRLYLWQCWNKNGNNDCM